MTIHWGTISGIVLILVGAVFVGIGQRVDDEVGSFYGVMRRRVLALRRRLPLSRTQRARAARIDRQPTVALSHTSPEVARVVAQLQQGTLTETEKGQIAAALAGQMPSAALPTSAAPQSADVTEALDLATVASSAVKRVGERGVLAMRFMGIVMVLLGIGVVVVGLRIP